MCLSILASSQFLSTDAEEKTLTGLGYFAPCRMASEPDLKTVNTARSLQWYGENLRGRNKFTSPCRAELESWLEKEQVTSKCLGSLIPLEFAFILPEKAQGSYYASKETELAGWELPNLDRGEQG